MRFCSVRATGARTYGCRVAGRLCVRRAEYTHARRSPHDTPSPLRLGVRPMTGSGVQPLVVPDGFWARDPVLDALRRRDIGGLFRLVSKYTGASQTQLAIAVGMTQGRISEIT